MTDRAPAPADVETIAPDLLEVAARAVAEAAGDGCFDRIDAADCGCDDDCVDHEDAAYYRSLARAALASPALATLRAHERANALRDAADELHRLWVKDGRHYGHPGCYSSGYEVWLRDRADRQEPQP